MFRDESQQVVRKARTGSSGRRSKKEAVRKTQNNAAAVQESPDRSESHSVHGGSPDGSSVRKVSSPESSVPSVFSGVSPVGKVSSPVPAQSPSVPSVFTASDTSDAKDVEEVQLINGEQLHLQQLMYEPCGIQPSWQLTVDEAASYFLRHNVWPGEMFMVNFKLKSPGNPSATLSEQAQMAALVSVGTAMLSRVRRSKDLQTTAEQEYGRAMSFLYMAFANETESRANATLSAVLLLAIFEVCWCSSRGLS